MPATAEPKTAPLAGPLLSDFLEQHGACSSGARWAKRLGSQSMRRLHALLKRRKRHQGRTAGWIVWAYTRPAVLGHKDLVRFAVFCAKQVEAQMPKASKDALAVVERWLDGKATQEEVAAAADAYAAYAARSAAAYTAAATAARAAEVAEARAADAAARSAAALAAHAAAATAAHATTTAADAAALAAHTAHAAAHAAARSAALAVTRSAALAVTRAARDDAGRKAQAAYLLRLPCPVCRSK